MAPSGRGHGSTEAMTESLPVRRSRRRRHEEPRVPASGRRPSTRSSRPYEPGLHRRCPRRGSRRAVGAGRPRCERSGPGPSTRRGTRSSADPGSWPPPGRAPTAASISPPTPPGGSSRSSRPFNLGPAEPARAQPGRPRPVRARDRGAAASLPPADRPQRGGLVPALQRAGRRFRPRLAGHQGRARRRRLGRHRPEGVDHVGAPLRLGRAPGPHRRRRAEAPGAHLLPHRPAPAGRRGPPAAPHGR